MVLKSRLIKAANQVWESLNNQDLQEQSFVATNSSLKGLAIISFVMLSVMVRHKVFSIAKVHIYLKVIMNFFLSNHKFFCFLGSLYEIEEDGYLVLNV